MLGAIYIGLSGLTAYSGGLKTISNNVGNLNSAGFKADNVNFTDLYGQGGDVLTFAQGVGDGVRMTRTTIDFTQGDLRASTGDLDLAISGKGFFVLLNGDKTYYTRTGQFEIDADGFISQQNTPNHLGLLGGDGQVTALNINDRRTSAPLVTSAITFADNLSSTATDHTVSDIAVYDSRGNKHVWTLAFTRPDAPDPTDPLAQVGLSNQWLLTITDETGSTVAEETLDFIGNTIDPASAKFVVEAKPDGADPLSVTLDFSTVTSFSGGTFSTLRAAKVDGHGAGQLTTITIDENGRIRLGYSNGESETLDAVAIADFRDPQQLVKTGD
ncbi:MAG: flagellar hook-basal body complex protein, partial [Novosphingobium sp.]|nr:flagellar hook-basal body complex protein [Novosphingobium sp.]